MRVTIVTPSLNQSRYIVSAIESVLSQDHSEIDYIVMDGDSTDGTREKLDPYRDRVRVVCEPDLGQADAIDRGFRGGDGEILAWLNADDVYTPGAVGRAVRYLRDHPAVDVVYGMAEFIAADDSPLGPCRHVEPFDAWRLLHVDDFIVQPTVFMRRHAYDRAGGLDARLNYCLDYDLWLRLARSCLFTLLPEVQALVRVHAETKTALGGSARMDEIAAMVARYGRRRLPQGFYRSGAKWAWHQALEDLRRGRVGSGVTAVTRAVRYGTAYGLGRLTGRQR